MTDFIIGPLPLWAEILTAVFAVLGAAFAAIGSFGLVRLPTFFRRIHAPTLGATVGVWCVTLATIIYFSVQGFSLFLLKAIMNGRGDEILELVQTNLRR